MTGQQAPLSGRQKTGSIGTKQRFMIIGSILLKNIIQHGNTAQMQQ
jgi:hypothetical protein